VVATDAAGRARAVMPAGATVAIARLDFGQRELTVFVDVPAGAALTDGPPLPTVPGGVDLGARQATVAPYVGVAQLAASCGGVGGGFGGQPLTWRQAACARSGDATVVATSADELGQRQYAARRHVDLALDAEVALPAWRPLATSAVAVNPHINCFFIVLPFPGITSLIAQWIEVVYRFTAVCTDPPAQAA